MKNTVGILKKYAASGLILVFSALGTANAAPPTEPNDSLYNDLGGEDHIAIFTNEFVGIISTDPRIRQYFDGANLPRLAKLLTQEFSFLAGGPVVYTGHNMKETHQGMGLHEAQFNALVEDLQLAMDHANIPFFVQNRLLARLAPLEHEIVTK